MVGDGVEAAGAFEESEIVSDKTEGEKDGPRRPASLLPV